MRPDSRIPEVSAVRELGRGGGLNAERKGREHLPEGQVLEGDLAARGGQPGHSPATGLSGI